MPSFHRDIRVLLALTVLLVAAAARPAGAGDRGEFVFHGRVLDESGAPIPGAWVVVKGSRRLGTVVDPDGGYELSVPGGTSNELTHSPLRLRVQARRSGWHFRVAGGAPLLGIEMGIERDSSGVPQLVVHSNEPLAAAATANAAVLEPTPRVDLEVNFVGAPGKQAGDEDVELASVQRVVLVGGPEAPETEHPGTAAESRPAGEGGAPPGDSVHASEPHAVPAGAVVRAVPEAQAAKLIPAPSSEKSGTQAPTSKTKPAGSAKVTPREAEPAGRGPAPQASTVVPRPPKAESSEPLRPVPATSPGAERPAAAPPRAGASRETTATKVESRAAREPRSAAPSEPAASKAPASEKASPAPAEPTKTRAAVKPAPPPTITLVGAGPIARQAPGAPPAAEPCRCEIRGTVEVDSDRPLEESTPVVIWLEDQPAVRDTAVLFMGSPRAFALHGVACGSHRLLVQVLGKTRGRAALRAPIDCAGGGSRSQRLVLVPARGGWNLR